MLLMLCRMLHRTLGNKRYQQYWNPWVPFSMMPGQSTCDLFGISPNLSGQMNVDTVFCPAYPWEDHTLTHNDPRSPIHLHNMRLDPFIGSIAHNLGVLPRPLHHRVIHNRSEASPLCLLKIFMIFDLKKKKKVLLIQTEIPHCLTKFLHKYPKNNVRNQTLIILYF